MPPGSRTRWRSYAGAKHGYAPPDMPAYNEAASERHWREMLKLFDEKLKA